MRSCNVRCSYLDRQIKLGFTGRHVSQPWSQEKKCRQAGLFSEEFPLSWILFVLCLRNVSLGDDGFECKCISAQRLLESIISKSYWHWRKEKGNIRLLLPASVCFCVGRESSRECPPLILTWKPWPVPGDPWHLPPGIMHQVHSGLFLTLSSLLTSPTFSFPPCPNCT